MEIYKQTTEISTKMTHSTSKSAPFIMTAMIFFMVSKGFKYVHEHVDPPKDA